MEFLGPAITIISLLVAFISGIILLVAAFRESILWGLGSLFVPFVSLIFVVMHWATVWRSFLVNVASTVVCIGSLLLWPGVWSNVRNAMENGGNDSDPQDLTAEIQYQRERIEKLEVEFSTQGAEVIRQHQALTARRASLKAGDDAATATYNAEVAAYQAKNGSQKTLQQDIATARGELEELLAKRSRASARGVPQNAANRGSHRVVMYTTRSCPACRTAKSYFARRGISYEERDVEGDPAAQNEFRQLGGTHVPLLIVDGEKVRFDPRRLDQLL